MLLNLLEVDMAKIKKITCKKCKYSFEIGSADDKRKKEWSMVAPMPDKDGNVTITMMATWDCPNCGKNITGSAGKTKGEFSGKSRKEKIEDKLAENAKFSIGDFAKEIGVEEENLLKILEVMVKKGQAKGKLTSSEYIPN